MKVRIRKSNLKKARLSGFRAKSRTIGGRRALKKARTGRKQKPNRKPQPKPKRR